MRSAAVLRRRGNSARPQPWPPVAVAAQSRRWERQAAAARPPVLPQLLPTTTTKRRFFCVAAVLAVRRLRSFVLRENSVTESRPPPLRMDYQ